MLQLAVWVMVLPIEVSGVGVNCGYTPYIERMTRIGEAKHPGPGVTLPTFEDGDPDEELARLLRQAEAERAYRSCVQPVQTLPYAPWTEDFVRLNTQMPHLAVGHFNITTWGDEIEQALADTKLDVVAICEHHLLETDNVAKRLAASGWVGLWHPAVKSKAQDQRQAAGTVTRTVGTSAGVCLLWRHHLSVESLPPKLAAKAYEDPMVASRFVCACVRLRGMTVIVAEVYLWTAEGMSSRNMAILNHIA